MNVQHAWAIGEAFFLSAQRQVYRGLVSGGYSGVEGGWLTSLLSMEEACAVRVGKQ